MFLCNDCRDKFTCRTGTIFERSHIPLHKWLLATHLVAASKKGMSALQLSRMLGLSYKSAWFMCHRIREGMNPAAPRPIGGDNKVVEADETLFGGKKKNRAFAKKEPKKHAVMTLVERDGESRSFHVANVKAKTSVKLSSRSQAASHISQQTNSRATRRSVRSSQATAPSIIRPMNMCASAALFMSTRRNAVSAL